MKGLMMCERCHKHRAVVFVSTNDSESEPRGYCLSCAKELGLGSINGILDKMGITDDQIDSMMEEITSDENSDILKRLFESRNPSDDEDDEDDDEIDFELVEDDDDEKSDFIHGAPTFPGFPFGRSKASSSQSGSKRGDSKLDSSGDKPKAPKKKYKYLDVYCENITYKAKKGEIDRIIGRDNETARVIQILSRRTKNNPCLIGEPGVGKTAIVEGLALRIAAGKVPYKLKKKQLYRLDITSLVAGTQFRGQFEMRIKGLIEDIRDHGNVILFIDEIHNIVGAGDSSDGTMNAANMIKPALSRGEIQVVGATTFREYRKYIEKDAALERRFQPVTVAEPSINDTTEMLCGIKSYYEEFHNVKIDDAIVRRTVVLAERYITDRFLPDKAIDLLDESCVNASLRNKKLSQYMKLKDKLAVLTKEEDKLISEDDIDYAKVSEVRTEIARINKEIDDFTEEDRITTVGVDDIAKAVEVWTGIPASKVQQNELKTLADLDKKLKQKVIGQDEAIDALSAAIKRSRVQISPRRHPASFIFVGPTGVGKTELVKVMAAELFDSPETLIRLDMSEFMEKHSVSKIIGSPPGYVGYDEAGQVTEKVRRRPYSVLLFDEIEKAHPDVLNILLQILDEGRLTDAHGRVVNFENTVIVMTSNAGSEIRGGIVGFNKSENELSKEKTSKALSDFLRPEFIARVDEIINFNKLTKDNYVDIAKLLMSEYVDSLKEKGITFTFDDASAQCLADKAYGKKNGARDLRNLIRKEIEDAITDLMVKNDGDPFSQISVTEKDGKILLST